MVFFFLFLFSFGFLFVVAVFISFSLLFFFLLTDEVIRVVPGQADIDPQHRASLWHLPMIADVEGRGEGDLCWITGYGGQSKILLVLKLFRSCRPILF